MPTGIGANSAAATGRESTWGTGVAAIELIPYVSETILPTRDVVTEDYHHGQPTQKNYQVTYKRVQGGLVAQGLYDTIAGDPIGIGSLIKSALGSAAWEVTPGKNEFEPTADLAAYFTLAFNKNVSIWELQGGIMQSMEIAANVSDAKVTFTFNMIGKKLLKTGDAGIVNTSSTFTGLAPTVIPTLMTFDQAKARLAAHGAPLAAANQIGITSFRLLFDNVMSEVDFSTPLNNESALDPLLPIRSGKRNVTIELALARYVDNTIFTQYDANTPLQFDLKFLYGTHEFNIFLPNVRVENPAASVADATFIKPTFNLKALSNELGTINADMTFESTNPINYEIGIETKNARTAVPA